MTNQLSAMEALRVELAQVKADRDQWKANAEDYASRLAAAERMTGTTVVADDAAKERVATLLAEYRGYAMAGPLELYRAAEILLVATVGGNRV